MIDKTAVIEEGAFLGKNVTVGPYAVICRGARIGDNVRIGSSACIKGDTRVEDGTVIGIGAVIGEGPQMVHTGTARGRIEIGRNNVIREYVTINASSGENTVTRLGDNNYLMAFAHIAHDCDIADNVVVCNGALVAGHVSVGERAFISGYAVIHQFARIGRLAMIAGLARVSQDVLPFMLVMGNSQIWGVNSVGLKRAGFTLTQRKDIKNVFSRVYRKKDPVARAVEDLEKEESEVVREIVSFIKSSKRGICSGKDDSFLERAVLEYPVLFLNRIKTYSLFLKSRKR